MFKQGLASLAFSLALAGCSSRASRPTPTDAEYFPSRDEILSLSPSEQEEIARLRHDIESTALASRELADQKRQELYNQRFDRIQQAQRAAS